MSSEREREAVLAVFEAMSDAWAVRDASRFASCYADEATVIGPGIYLRGMGDIHVSMAAAFAGPLKDSTRPHSVRSVRFLSGDTAVVVTGSVTLLSGEAQAPPERQHLVTWVLARRDGRWLVEANHLSPIN